MTSKTIAASVRTDPWDESTRRSMLALGILFILTFVTSIPALLLYGPVLDHKDYVLGAGHDTRITFGALLEIALVVSNAGTAIVAFPALKRFSETISLAYVASRLFESVMIAVGALSLLAVVTMRQDLGGANAADAAALTAAASALVAIHDWTFLIGPAFCAGFGNGILLGYLMYKSEIMPKRLALWGLIGGPIAVGTAVAVLFGAYDQTSPISFFFTVPEIIWESAVGIYLTVKALRLRGKAPVTRETVTATTATAATPA
jgi:hypothetical protein